ncbi:hypothetical protein GNZ12_24175 [Paraburkholderia sp. 1N]|uniref:Uncharacterized protein n=1 Tax=Paraburkholderia solitsugae TaxID=2675748 RepID=A0ABX2BWA4_9BURK|nr:hypothetical protein [Paraburkholderia solitsugae]NPT44351.1 hypothetical protein [Paraburkholderia solitsugae]
MSIGGVGLLTGIELRASNRSTKWAEWQAKLATLPPADRAKATAVLLRPIKVREMRRSNAQ